MAYNYSILSILATWSIALSGQIVAVATINTAGNNAKFDNANPRNQWDKLKAKLPNDVYTRAQRAHAAAANGLEALPYWGLAVLAGNLARLPVEVLNTHSLVFIAARILYMILYINISTFKASYLRTVTWAFGVGTAVNLFWKASQALNA